MAMTRITNSRSLRTTDGEERSPTRRRLYRWAGAAAVATTGAVLAVSGLTAEAGDAEPHPRTAASEPTATTDCPRPGSADSYLPGSRNVPIC